MMEQIGEKETLSYLDDPWSTNKPTATTTNPSPSNQVIDNPIQIGWPSDSNSSSNSNPDPNPSLNPSRLPRIFSQAWQAVAASDLHSISFDQLNSVLATSGLSPPLLQKIISASCSSSTCSRDDFNLALVMVSQAQSGQEVDISEAQSILSSSLDPSDPSPIPIPIPIPTLSLSNLDSNHQSPTVPIDSSTVPATRSSKKDDSIMSDPWGQTVQAVAVTSNGLPSSSDGLISDSTFQRKNTATSSRSTDSLNQVFPKTSRGFSSRKISRSDPIQLSSSQPNPEIILTKSSSQSGSIPFWKHNTYTLISQKRGTKVENRRYSDFVFLHGFLVKKYPFRLIPNLPPKRIKVSMNLASLNLNVLSGNAISDDSSSSITAQQDNLNGDSIFASNELLKNDKEFNKDRIRGLLRYLNLLESHPVLSKDPLLEAFFSEKANFLDWKDKQTEMDQSAHSLPPHSSSAGSAAIPFLQTSIDFIHKSIDPSSQSFSIDDSKSILNPTEESLRSGTFLTEFELMEIPVDFELRLNNFTLFVKESHDKLEKLVRTTEKITKGFEELSLNFDGLSFCLNSLREIERNNEEGIHSQQERRRRGRDPSQEGIQNQDASQLIKSQADSNTKSNIDWSEKVFELTENLGGIFQERGERTENNFLEGLKYQLSIFQSFLNLSARHQKLQKDPVETLRKRTDSNQSKLNSILTEKKMNYQTEEAKLRKEIEMDRELIDLFLNRRNHSRLIILQEIDHLREISVGIQQVWARFWQSEKAVAERERGCF